MRNDDTLKTLQTWTLAPAGEEEPEEREGSFFRSKIFALFAVFRFSPLFIREAADGRRLFDGVVARERRKEVHGYSQSDHWSFTSGSVTDCSQRSAKEKHAQLGTAQDLTAVSGSPCHVRLISLRSGYRAFVSLGQVSL